MHATQIKLAEMAFFFQKMEALESKIFSPEPQAFGFYLSAFLSAGRSVTLVLQKEHKEEYARWFPSWLASITDEQRDLLDYFNNLRVDTIHKLGVDLSHRRVEISTNEYLMAASHEGANIQIWHPIGVPAPPQQKLVRTLADGGSDREVLVACRSYLELISNGIGLFTEANASVAP